MALNDREGGEVCVEVLEAPADIDCERVACWLDDSDAERDTEMLCEGTLDTAKLGDGDCVPDGKHVVLEVAVLVMVDVEDDVAVAVGAPSSNARKKLICALVVANCITAVPAPSAVKFHELVADGRAAANPDKGTSAGWAQRIRAIGAPGGA